MLGHVEIPGSINLSETLGRLELRLRKLGLLRYVGLLGLLLGMSTAIEDLCTVVKRTCVLWPIRISVVSHTSFKVP